MTPYGILLVAHSYVRWAILALAGTLMIRCAMGSAQKRPFTQGDERTHVAFVGFVDLQLLLGVLLYVHSSPIVRAFLADPKHAMKVTELRFFGVEHPVTMLAALALVHVGRSRSKKGTRHERALRWTIAAVLVMLVGMPWPFLHQRPWLRTTPSGAVATTQCPPVYAARCAPCHGGLGHGDGIAAALLSPRPRDFADPKWRISRTDAEIAAIISEGGARHGLSQAMPAQTDLTAADVDALVSCVRSMAQ